MAGIFGGHLFQGQGLGQTTAAEDAEFNATIASLATPTTGSGTSTGSKTGGAAYLPGVPSTGSKTGGAAYIPGTTTSAVPVPVAAPNDNTTLYVVGGVAALGILGIIMMSNRRGTVAANRGRRARRSRARGR